MPRRRLRPRHLVTHKGGRSYWQPTAKLREAGFKLTRLLPENGDIWEQAEALNRQVDKWRIGLLNPDGNPKPLPGTVAALAAAYQESVDFLDLAEKTRIGYKSSLKILCEIGDEKHPFGRELVRGVTPPVVQLAKTTLRARGAYQANAVLTTARLTWAWGIRNGEATANACGAPRNFRVKPRDQIWTAAHREVFKAKAIA